MTNKTTTKAGLNMETPELMMKGGESDKGILPGKGADSIIYQAAAHTWDSDMPPKGNKVGAKNLSPEELTLLKQWIDEGAAVGTAAQCAEQLMAYLDAGADEILLHGAAPKDMGPLTAELKVALAAKGL